MLLTPWGALSFFSFYFVVCCCFLVKFRKPLWRAVCCVFHLISHSPLQTESASELEHCSMSWLQLSTKLSSWALSQVTPRKRDSCPTNVPTSCVIGEKITVRKGINSWNTRKYVQKVSIRWCERSVLKVHRVHRVYWPNVQTKGTPLYTVHTVLKCRLSVHGVI